MEDLLSESYFPAMHVDVIYPVSTHLNYFHDRCGRDIDRWMEFSCRQIDRYIDRQMDRSSNHVRSSSMIQFHNASLLTLKFQLMLRTCVHAVGFDQAHSREHGRDHRQFDPRQKPMNNQSQHSTNLHLLLPFCLPAGMQQVASQLARNDMETGKPADP